MTKSMRASALIALTFVLGSIAVAAPPAPPEQVTYQGVLLDDQGQARTGTVDLTLRVYDALVGGTLLYKQIHSTVPLSDGVFTVQLGPTGAATDTPTNPLTTSLADALTADLGPTGPSRFLEVTVGTDGPLSRTQILNVPYALRAENAASADVAATAGIATTALNAQSVNGLDSSVVTEIWEHFSFDGANPPNDDPSEGLADVDGDGLANFVDNDNDGDGLFDGTELSQGSNINLVTPRITSLVPSTAAANASSSVSVQGSGFEPGVSVVFGVQDPTPTNLNSTSFDVQVGPHPAGNANVQVTNANGEISDVETFTFTSGSVPVQVALNSVSQLTLDVTPSFRVIVGGIDEYAVDTVDDGVPDLLVPFPSEHANGQLAVAWDASGAAAGLRCRSLGGGACSVELVRDQDADFALEDTEGTEIEPVASPAQLWSPSLVFDVSGRPVAGYALRRFSASATVAHDRNGDGLFTGTNERVTLETFTGNNAKNLGQAAADASGRAAYVYFRDDPNTANDAIRVAYDRSGDGDFADTVSGNPELATLAAVTDVVCVGAAFDPSGRLAVLYGTATAAPVVARDLNGDGDFTDPGETTTIAAGPAAACAMGGGGGEKLVVVHNAGSLFLLVDRNDDGDFVDANEDQQIDQAGASFQHLAVSPLGSAAFVATDTDVRTWNIGP